MYKYKRQQWKYKVMMAINWSIQSKSLTPVIYMYADVSESNFSCTLGRGIASRGSRICNRREHACEFYATTPPNC
jgi:hypothetical protein